MATYLGTLTKTVVSGSGSAAVKHYIYPKTDDTVVKHGNTTVNAVLTTLMGDSTTSGSVDYKIAHAGHVTTTSYATTSQAGIVKIGSGISVTNDGEVSIDAMTGAATNAAGTAGIVPAPSAGDEDKYLKGDGTWFTPPSATPASTSQAGIVQLNDTTSSTSTSQAATANAVKAAYDAAVAVMTAASSSSAGTAGRVPAPASGDQDKYLRGDATWVALPIYVSDDYGSYLTKIVDSSGNEVAHFDEYGNLHLTGNIYAANLPPIS